MALSALQPALPFKVNALRFAPWWLSGWGLVLAALVVLGFSALWLQWRFRRLWRRNLALETRLEANTADLEQTRRALRETALVDTLTGLHNRRYLDAAMATDAHQAQRAFRDLLAAGSDPLSAREDLLLFLLDVDHFKRINETWGDPAGDAVLRQLGLALRSLTRKTDHRVRWADGTFLLVARRARRSGAAGMARKLLAEIRDLTFQLPGGETIRECASIGYTAFPLHPGHPELGTWPQALGIAEQCLRAAKLSGRDRWVGATLKADAEPGPLRGLASWDVAWGKAVGLMEVQSSEPGFSWPLPPAAGGAT